MPVCKVLGNRMAFQQQFERTVRWYERFRELDSGRAHTMPSDNYQDEIYAFFLNCFHLKDWIIEDPHVPATRGQVETYINNTPALALCADLCNALKHFTLRRRTRTGSQPHPGARNYSLNVGGGEATLGMRLTITNAGQSYDAFQIASDSLEAWVTFLNAAGYQLAMPQPPAVAPAVAPSPTFAMGVPSADLRVERQQTRTFGKTLARAGSALIWLGKRIGGVG